MKGPLASSDNVSGPLRRTTVPVRPTAEPPIEKRFGVQAMLTLVTSLVPTRPAALPTVHV